MEKDFDIEVPLRVKGIITKETKNSIVVSFSEETLKKQLAEFSKAKLMDIEIYSRGWRKIKGVKVKNGN